MLLSLLLSLAAHAGMPANCPVCECPQPAVLTPAPLPQRTDLVHKGDTALTLVGPALQTGQPAPTELLRDAHLAPVSPDFADGRVHVVLTVPSLDTPTCSLETRTFDQDASDLGPGIEILVISRDLPFAQARYCAAEGIDRVLTLSDYVDGSFGKAWGVYIAQSGLLARTVTIIDGQGIVRYQQIVPQLGDEPDYNTALQQARALVP